MVKDINPATGREAWDRIESGGWAAVLDRDDDGAWIWWVMPRHIATSAFGALDVNHSFADEASVDPATELTEWAEMFV